MKLSSLICNRRGIAVALSALCVLLIPHSVFAKATIPQGNISVVSSKNPATYGESYTFSTHITVSGSTTPSGGTVKFMEVFPGQGFQIPLGYATLDASSNASLTLTRADATYLAASTTAHQIKVAYLGDANFNSATSSAALSQTIALDAVAPTITLFGSASMSIAKGSTYIDPGATATDNIDGSLTSSIVVGGAAVSTQTSGVYVVTYTVTDSSGNNAQVSRTVTVSDTVPPAITLLGNTPMQVRHNTTFTDPGAAVTDDFDAGLSAVATGLVDTSVLGTSTITYTASDRSGNAATPVVRTVVVVDTDGPIITLAGENPQRISLMGSYVELGATVIDDTDTGLPIIIDATHVQPSIAGTYFVTYDAVDNAGNPAIQVTRSVIVADTTAPILTLTGAASVSLAEGDAYTDAGATATDDVDSTVAVAASGAVNTAAAGTYTITYSATDQAGNVATPVTRTVVVSALARRSSGGGGGGRSSSVARTGTVLAPSAGRVLGATTYAFGTSLSVGMTGEAVTELQKILVAQGLLGATAPLGYFGPQTRAAVRAYQAAHGLPQTGYVGPMTLALLNAGTSAQGVATPTTSTATTIASLMAQLEVLKAKLAALKGT